jgi:hypothetical protein
MCPILETSKDEKAERVSIRRLLGLASHYQALKMPQLSCVDYILTKNGQAKALIEIKSRKSTAESVRAFGGLILKERKHEELAAIAKLLRLRAVVLFAFENGYGDLYSYDTENKEGLVATVPPRRNNYRGLPCDEELVFMLDWDQHLTHIARPLEKKFSEGVYNL